MSYLAEDARNYELDSDHTNGHGSSAYNKLIDYAMKVCKSKEKNIKAIEESEKKTKEAERKKAENFARKRQSVRLLKEKNRFQYRLRQFAVQWQQ